MKKIKLILNKIFKKHKMSKQDLEKEISSLKETLSRMETFLKTKDDTIQKLNEALQKAEAQITTLLSGGNRLKSEQDRMNKMQKRASNEFNDNSRNY
jgi:chromosome segregation ATPase